MCNIQNRVGPKWDLAHFGPQGWYAKRLHKKRINWWVIAAVAVSCGVWTAIVTLVAWAVR